MGLKGSPVGAFAALTVVVMTGCAVSGPTPAPTRLAGVPPAVLPGSGELVPPGTSGAQDWVGSEATPPTFEHREAYSTPAELANAFGAALELATDTTAGDAISYSHHDERAVFLVTLAGEDGDLTRGSQHALVMGRSATGWRLGAVYVRQLCAGGERAERCDS